MSEEFEDDFIPYEEKPDKPKEKPKNIIAPPPELRWNYIKSPEYNEEYPNGEKVAGDPTDICNILSGSKYDK
jgi:hypothetical protein